MVSLSSVRHAGRGWKGAVAGGVAAVSLLLTGCQRVEADPAECVRAEGKPEASAAECGIWAKIRFSLEGIDAAGLEGPPSGRRSVVYEFCVPDVPAARDVVRRIDTRAQFFRSPGRVGCGDGELLVMSDTQRPDWRCVLAELAALPFVWEIRRTDFE
ncbi:MAG: hypothetical protein D6781_03320 [Verrucomicrobia bacterium]|nr:MAG: hypothetical protein D6781_03320 [Verrucomicrobiota bacterium]